ncbi:MAG: hypothetical protein JWL80_388 [Parcubacteria group bacterium]|nr:hypothetical protein [Parcubacteria group bacterium]
MNHVHYTPPPPIFENTASTQKLRVTISTKIRQVEEDPEKKDAVQDLQNILNGNYDPEALKRLDLRIDKLLE